MQIQKPPEFRKYADSGGFSFSSYFRVIRKGRMGHAVDRVAPLVCIMSFLSYFVTCF